MSDGIGFWLFSAVLIVLLFLNDHWDDISAALTGACR